MSGSLGAHPNLGVQQGVGFEIAGDATKPLGVEVRSRRVAAWIPWPGCHSRWPEECVNKGSSLSDAGPMNAFIFVLIWRSLPALRKRARQVGGCSLSLSNGW